MRVLVLSDGIGSLSAVDTVEVAEAGWKDAVHDELDLMPVSAGSRGFLSALAANTAGEIMLHSVRGPLGETVPAPIFLTGSGGNRTAYLEAAQVCGLHLVDPARRDPRTTSTWGLGQLLLAALETGASRIVVGLGGTATNDAGAGMLAALGLGSAAKLDQGPLSLVDVTPEDLDFTAVREAFAQVDLIAACATSAPLAGFTGASGGYSGGKGASRAVAQDLERALTHFANSCAAATAEVAHQAPDAGAILAPEYARGYIDVDELKTVPGAGSGGGLGFGLGLLGARLLPGGELMSNAIGIEERAAQADLIFAITDGLDATTLGDGPIEMAVAAGRSNALATVALARRVDAGNRELATAGISAAYELFDRVGGAENQHDRLALEQRVGRIARSWSR